MTDKIRVIRDASHSTRAATIEGAVYEVVFQSDENYWNLGMFDSEEVAELVATRGNSFLDPEDLKRDIGFQIREHKVVTAVSDDWSRQDFVDEMDGWDLNDYFLPEIDPEDGDDG